MKSAKAIVKMVKGYSTQDGAGVNLIRVIGHDDVYEADPFLMLDAFDSTDPADYIKGFPMHPHRGIETVTYLIEGQIDHRDSLGNEGSIRKGQSQWMTAGSGILHEEMPQESERLFGLQLWVNLPQRDKMTPPQYFDITNEMIQTAAVESGVVRVISGEFEGIKGVEPRHVAVTMLDISLDPEGQLEIPIDNESTVLVYTLEGSGFFGPETSQAVDRRTAAIFGRGDVFPVRAGVDGLHFMLFAGRPLREQIAWGGPIVMNTQEELRTAFAELDKGTFIK